VFSVSGPCGPISSLRSCQFQARHSGCKSSTDKCSTGNTQAKQLLSQQDAVIKENAFWMPNIKTHCYVIFETAEQAETIRC